MNKFLFKSILTIALASVSTITMSEDIELYISDVVRQAGKSTKVLIIFDNSGSMGTTHTVQEDFDSDPAETYPPEGAAHAYNDDFIYFNKGGADNSSTIPSSPSDARRFIEAINGCEASKKILEQFGTYTGRIREYSFKGNSGTWQEIPDNNGANIEILDCEDDAYIEDSQGKVINEGSPINADPLVLGYPVNNLGSKQAPQYYDNSIPKTSSNVDWSSGSYVTLYTAKYLRWFYGQSVNDLVETRMDTAKKSIVSVINTTPSVDFGLEVFNINKGDGSDDGNGGRIALGIEEMNDANKADLLDIINNQLTASTWTPLCESLFESHQYFSGSDVTFGDKDVNRNGYTKNKPPQDTSIIDGNNNYISPFDNCASSIAHVILITDGEPTNDFGADSNIEALSVLVPKVDGDGFPVFDNNGDPEYVSQFFNGERYTDDNSNSYLPALAEWMSIYDINPDIEGSQTISTHTIGFSSGADGAAGLLRETARRGGGQYFTANSGLQLTQALINILNKLPKSNDSLTSASVAANNFDRTQTLDSVYYSMFEPQTGSRWQGNLKKYKAVDGKLTGVGGADAICEVGGRRSFCETVRSYWSPGIDGDNVGKGGVASWFHSKTPSDRTLYMDAGVGSVIKYNQSNLEKAYTDATGLATELGVVGLVDKDGNSIEAQAVTDLIAWSTGVDVDDEDKDGSKIDMRHDVFGDPLHSKPLVVNYGNSIRVVVGTNAGALHMFEDSGSSVKENWAFMPKEFIRNIKSLRENFSSSNKVYGIDGEITVHLNDKDGNGKIEGTDTAWIFFGLRRGGSSYYALDISNPDAAPKLMWHIDSSDPDFTNLGQSWSKPKVAYSQLNTSGTTASPVLFIGGGYDTNKDSSGVGKDDSKGQAIYMLDAQTGKLLWSLETSGGSTSFNGTDSIPSAIGILDSTGDGLVDRLYAGDTGGNIWRVDMPGADKSKFSVFQLASLGHETSNLYDQRFFYEPTIVRTFISETIETDVNDGLGGTKKIAVHQEIPYDAVLIGSGDRSNPLGKDTTDTLYMIKDSNVVTQTFSGSSVPPIPTVLNKSDLYDYTGNPFSKPMTTQEEETLKVAVSNKSGWYLDLLESGEKTTAAGLVINGVAYFTTYSPAAVADLIDCKPPQGSGWLYAIDLALGIKKHLVVDDVRDNDNRAIKVNNEWLGSPTLIVLPEDDGDTNTVDDGKGDIIVGDAIIPVGFTLSTSRTYLYRREQQ